MLIAESIITTADLVNYVHVPYEETNNIIWNNVLFVEKIGIHFSLQHVDFFLKYQVNFFSNF